LRQLKLVIVGVLTILAASATAHAQQARTNAFDGTYLGVSSSTNGSHPACVVYPAPMPLVISGGRAVFTTRTGDTYEGVSPDGSIKMRDQRVNILNGKIDATGKMEGSTVGGSETPCVFSYVWQKQK
jgi:hypothetical protein